MKFINNILAISMLLFFIGCTAWPILVPPPSGKKKTAIYPIPLPSTSTIADVRIADKDLKPLADSILQFTFTLQLAAINKDGTDISSSITWSSSDTTIATISATGLVTALSKAGVATITATHATLTPAATVKITVSADGKSILAFDGKQFIRLSSKPIVNINEEK